jgi:two-component system phosphate regulon sensor histidine kinase PhoR
MARKDFMANISHELRTPLAAMKAVVETLEDGALDDHTAARSFLARLHDEVDALAQLVNELLELSRIESGQAEIALAPTAIEPLLVATAERFEALARRAGLELVLSTSLRLPAVVADAERIGQVLANLIHNAIKFTPAGGRVELRAEVCTGAGERARESVRAGAGDGKPRASELVVSVADSGIGVPPDDLERIFERFYKTDRSRSSGGSGLGLAIAKHLVQAHGGRIWAESGGAHGTTFSFTLPLARSSTSCSAPGYNARA